MAVWFLVRASANVVNVTAPAPYTPWFIPQDYPDGTIFDAHGETFYWRNSSNPDPDGEQGYTGEGALTRNGYPIRMENFVILNPTWRGGRAIGEMSLTADRSVWSDQPGGYINSAALTIQGGGVASTNRTVKDFRADRGWDGIRVSGGMDAPLGGFHHVVEGVWLSNIRDDAVENDGLASLIIRDSLFDGVFGGVSAVYGGGEADHSASDSIDIIDTLIRLVGQPTTTSGTVVPAVNYIYVPYKCAVTSPDWTMTNSIIAISEWNKYTPITSENAWIAGWAKITDLGGNKLLFLGYDNVTFTAGTPGTVNYTDHVRIANAHIKFKSTDTLPPEITSETSYYIKTVLGANSFTVSATPGGTAINFSGTGTGTHSASAMPDLSGPVNMVPAGFDEDVGASAISTWNTARSTWLATHPNVDRLDTDTE